MEGDKREGRNRKRKQIPHLAKNTGFGMTREGVKGKRVKRRHKEKEEKQIPHPAKGVWIRDDKAKGWRAREKRKADPSPPFACLEHAGKARPDSG